MYIYIYVCMYTERERERERERDGVKRGGGSFRDTSKRTAVKTNHFPNGGWRKRRKEKLKSLFSS